MSDKNKDTIRKANELLAAGNCDAFVKLCSENVKWTLLADKPNILKGREELRKFMTPKAEESLDLPDFTVDNLIGEGDVVISNGEMTMKEKDGTNGKYRYCDIYTFKNGEIAEFLTHMNKTEAKKGQENSATA